MSRAARSLLIFGVYLVILGWVLLLIPNALLGLFGVPPTDEVWILIVGMVVFFLGLYHILAARSEALPYIRASVGLRLLVPVFFAGFVILGYAPPALLLFALIDAASAVWTLVELRRTQP